jgi:hypothetical protein
MAHPRVWSAIGQQVGPHQQTTRLRLDALAQGRKPDRTAGRLVVQIEHHRDGALTEHVGAEKPGVVVLVEALTSPIVHGLPLLEMVRPHRESPVQPAFHAAQQSDRGLAHPRFARRGARPPVGLSRYQDTVRSAVNQRALPPPRMLELVQHVAAFGAGQHTVQAGDGTGRQRHRSHEITSGTPVYASNRAAAGDAKYRRSQTNELRCRSANPSWSAQWATRRARS